MQIEEKTLRFARIGKEIYIHQGDVCAIVAGIKMACSSLDGRKNFEELLKTFGCIPCENGDHFPKPKDG